MNNDGGNIHREVAKGNVWIGNCFFQCIPNVSNLRDRLSGGLVEHQLDLRLCFCIHTGMENRCESKNNRPDEKDPIFCLVDHIEHCSNSYCKFLELCTLRVI